MKELTSKDFDRVTKTNRRSVVAFKSNGCHLCVALQPILDEVSEIYAEKCKFYNLNIDLPENELIAKKFIQNGVPTLYLFEKGRVYEIPDPENPANGSWFSEQYLSGFLNGVLKEKMED
jgi:thioredoxin 1